jgi:hypothetical protein
VLYRFRLTFFHSTPGFFRLQGKSVPLQLEEGREFELTARDSDTLGNAKKFHIEGRGYPDEAAARAAGERLRVRLRVLNAMLALGITVPLVDSTSGGVSSAIKKGIYEKTGGVAIDTIVGLGVFPDDDKHFEYVMSGDIDVYPSKPDYVLDAIRSLWPVEMTLDDRAEDAMNIVNISTTESSPRAKFLTTFLALERLIDRTSRSVAAKGLLSKFQENVRDSELSEHEKSSLIGSLAMLHEESFSSALTRFAQRIENPKEIGGLLVKQFFSRCIDVRNKIAHDASVDSNIDLNILSNELRKTVLALIWTTHRIPSVSVDVPASAVSIPAGGFSIRVL